MAAEQRNGNLGREARRPWIQRYMALILFIAANMIGVTGTLIVTWADTKTALGLAKENAEEIKKRTAIVMAVPHLDEKIDNHVEEFKDFRQEQRNYNKSIDGKLDYIIRNLGGN